MAERQHNYRRSHDTEDADDMPAQTYTPEAEAAPVVVPPVVVAEPELEPVPETPPAPAPSAQAVPSAHVAPVPTAPSLAHAFTVLCQALHGHLVDNQVEAQHCDEIQGWHANSGGDERHVNSIMAWRHAVQILEGVLAHSLTQR